MIDGGGARLRGKGACACWEGRPNGVVCEEILKRANQRCCIVRERVFACGIVSGNVGRARLRQIKGPMIAARMSVINTRRSADCSSHAIPGTPAANRNPTKQSFHARM